MRRRAIELVTGRDHCDLYRDMEQGEGHEPGNTMLLTKLVKPARAHQL
jgi:hypothetical protein